MKIDIGKLSGEIGESQIFNENIELKDLAFSGETLRFPKPLETKGRITNTDGNIFLLTADVKGKVLLQCGYCTKDYEYALDFSFEAKCAKSPSAEDPDIFILEDNYIDIEEIILEFLLLEIPLKRKCSENCKGLCPVCGVNLNLQNCNCNPEDETETNEKIDPRLQGLKDFFSSVDKEV